MPVSIQLEPSISPYKLSVTIDDFNLGFDVRWNEHDEAWYFDLYDEDDGKLILAGAKIVLGANIGGTSMHGFFGDHILRAVDTADHDGKHGRDATLHDLGVRVQLISLTLSEPFA